jgi:aryl-alcohol dehydrogenase-like predicted oxidoreductase
MQFEYIDVIYANPPLGGLGREELVTSIAGLIAAGKARAWAIVNWEADMLLEASQIATRLGIPQPGAAQLPYSLVHRSPVEDASMRTALDACAAAVVASFVLAGGVLTGKYDADPSAGRAAGSLDDPRLSNAVTAGRELAALARDLGTTPAALAIAFTLSNPSVASVLFGATRPAQIRENVAALDVVDHLDEQQLARLKSIGSAGE